MADPMAIAFVSSTLKLALDKLGSPTFQEIGRIIGVKNELKRVNDTLSTIDAVLLDAEEQQTTLHSVRNWLQKLKDVACDIEDVLDLISIQDLEKKVSGRSFTQKVGKRLSEYNLSRGLKDICNRLDEIASNRRNYNFQERQQPLLPSTTHASRERETHSSFQESHVFGREQDKEWIVTRLVTSSSQEITEIQVLPIVGMGGMGKTTLAKLVFNDPRVQEFKLRLWAYVPNRFVMRRVMENILQSATGESCSHLNMETMKSRFICILAAQTFLLVLDNVWINVEDTKEGLELKELIEKCAFKEGEEESYPLLVQIGKDIVRKCCGVPLAAKTLGSQLRTIRDDLTWKRIKESELWKIKQAPSDVIPALRLSFDQIPYHIRPCFAFCARYLKGELMSREGIILLWMALGFLESKDTNEALEDIGNGYFNELVSRSLFEVVHPFAYMVRLLALHNKTSETDMAIQLKEADGMLSYEPSYGKVIHVQMHDLVHDLVAYVATEETTIISCNTHDVSPRLNYLVWKEEDLSEREFPRQLSTASKARSLLFRCGNLGYMSKTFLHSLISHFRCLRILSLADFEFEISPNSIGDLKHLRYLSLAGNPKLKMLPNSICSKLVKLQTLDVLLCQQLEAFPRDMDRLLSLRHLLFTSKLASFPKTGFHGWTSIQHIMIVDCVHLTSLPEQIGTLISLRILRITSCPILTCLPSSMCGLAALEELQIDDCERLALMGWEGLQGLKSLRLLDMQQLPLLVHLPGGIQHLSACLRYLIIKRCRNFIALPECLEQCICLLKLTLLDCPGLNALPIGIQAIKSLQELWIAYCPKLSPRCEREGHGLASHLSHSFDST